MNEGCYSKPTVCGPKNGMSDQRRTCHFWVRILYRFFGGKNQQNFVVIKQYQNLTLLDQCDMRRKKAFFCFIFIVRKWSDTLMYLKKARVKHIFCSKKPDEDLKLFATNRIDSLTVPSYI